MIPGKGTVARGSRYNCGLEATLAEIALATNYSPWQVSRIINSPDFRERHERAAEFRRRMIVLRAIQHAMQR
jgi:hypothetical protein